MERQVKPFFSIIIPVYNAEEYIFETLESLEGQSFGQYEAIVVDDGSTDETYEAICRAVKSSCKIKMVRQANKGPLIARRTALSLAEGDYVVFLDSDDLLRNDALEKIRDATLTKNPDIVSYPYSRRLDFSLAERPRLPVGYYDKERYQKVKEVVCQGSFCSLWNKAVRRSCIDFDADYSSYEGFMHGEDFFQLIPIIDRAKSLMELEEPLYYYREREGSSTSRFRKKQLADIVTLNRRLRSFANRWGGLCPELASMGEAKQYVNLLKILEGSRFPASEKTKRYEAIRSVMSDEGVFERCRMSALRFDDHLVLSNLERSNIWIVRSLLQAVEKIKRLSWGLLLK